MVQERVKVVFTGQSGLGKREVIDDLKRFAESQGRHVAHFSVGEMMYRISNAARGRILRLPLGRLELVRSQAILEIQSHMNDNPMNDVFIDTHATFRWEGGLFSGFSPEEIMRLSPDLCITFVADVDRVKLGLAYSDYPLKLTLRDIITWREEEILCSSLISKIADCSHYLVPTSFQTDALYRLIHAPSAKKLYISFPISRIPSKSMKAGIAEFRSDFGHMGSCVVFDPIQVTEEPRLLAALKKTLKRKPDAASVSVTTIGQEVHLDVAELKDIKADIGKLTRSFDYRMIEQSNAIVAFVPEYRRRPYVAEGVFMEMAYAEHRAKEIYLVWGSGDSPSPMINADATFSTVREAVQFFEGDAAHES